MDFSFWNNLVQNIQNKAQVVRNVTTGFVSALSIFPAWIQQACFVILVLTVFFTVLAIIKHILDAIPFL